MKRAVFLDSGLLGLLTNPKTSPEAAACTVWLQKLLLKNWTVVVPELVDYEVRRELLRADKKTGLERLDSFVGLVEYLPITTAAMRQAARFWAMARKEGRPTAPDKALDGDMILLGQAATFEANQVVIATTNVGHLSRFATARLWREILPAD